MKIPKVCKFKGDNKQPVVTQITKFEAHARALDINQVKWKDNLLCCTESTVFTFMATEDETITYSASLGMIIAELFNINFVN